MARASARAVEWKECSGSHLAALGGTTSARLGTSLAMRMLVLGAFLSARVAHLGAQLAHALGELTASRHEAGSQTADCRAVHIERDTPRHHLDVLLSQARRSAVIAGVGAFIASLDAGFVGLLHRFLHHEVEGLWRRRGWQRLLRAKNPRTLADAWVVATRQTRRRWSTWATRPMQILPGPKQHLRRRRQGRTSNGKVRCAAAALPPRPWRGPHRRCAPSGGPCRVRAPRARRNQPHT